MSFRVSLQNANEVVIANAEASLPAPTADDDGAAVPRQGTYTEDTGMISIDSSGTGTIPAGAYLAGYTAHDDKWRRAGSIGRGEVISLTAAIGNVERVVGVGAFTRLDVVSGGGALTGGISVTVKYTPIETEGT
jgi:hypothetical protein